VSNASQLIKDWIAAPKNTARSVLVTIFGDTLLPVHTSVWLSDLFQLTDVLGFSERLVRTSMFRLAADGWLTSERIGRQSQYSLTTLAIEESEQAEQRIYHSPHPDWSGEWAVVFVDSHAVPATAHPQLVQHLQWQGFIALSPGVLASPTVAIDHARELCQRILPDTSVPIASLEFSELDALVANGFFAKALSLEEMANNYVDLIERYEPLTAESFVTNPAQAFGLRTMLIHDLRRIRLSGPDVPAVLLPNGWPGTTAHSLAARLYPSLSATASPWLSEVLAATYPSRLHTRFTTT